MKQKKRGLVSGVIGLFSRRKRRLLDADVKRFKARLDEGRQFQGPDVVMASRPTKKNVTVLFVCRAATHFSPTALSRFAEIARRKPVKANLLLRFAGKFGAKGKHLSTAVSEADFVVVVKPGMRHIVERDIEHLVRKPKVIDMESNNLADLLDKRRYHGLLGEIRGFLKQEKNK